MRLSPRRVLVVVVAFAVTAGAGALVGANFIKSPAQLAAEAQPPASGPVTVPVEKRVIRTSMVIRGEVTPETSLKVPAPTPRNTAKPVVTRMQAEDTVQAGRVVAEVSGRPVIALPGAITAYRDITPGAKGDDVAQLQAALKVDGDPKGTYGASTKAAVTKLYADLGYEPLPTSDGEVQQLRSANRQVRDLQRAYDSAAPEQKAAAGQALADAKTDLADLQARTGPTVPMGEIAFVPAFPARITSRAVQQGAQVTGELMTLAGGRLVVRAPVDDRDAQLVREGMPVEIGSETSGAALPGKVARVDAPTSAAAQQPAVQGAPAPAPVQDGRRTVVVQTDQPLPDELAGQNVRLTIIAASTDHDVLVVPLAAVSARDDGQSVVVRVVDGREERVVVSPGVSGGGFVEVRATEGSLGERDRVVIGR